MKKSATDMEKDKIVSRLTFLNEEEGRLSLVTWDGDEICFSVYPMGDGVAEVATQDMGFLLKNEESFKIDSKITYKMTKCIIEALRTLKEAGFSNLSVLGEKGSIFEEILGSTGVVQKQYSEYLMKYLGKRPETTSSCAKSSQKMSYKKTEDGYECRNKEKSFFARVSPYRDGWYVYEVEVSYDKRRTGIGTACMELLQERFLHVYLQVGSYNEPAMGLYRKLGYQIEEEICYYG